MEQFKTQCDDYIKFLFIHLIIVFTIVFSLDTAIDKIDGEDIRDKISALNSLCHEAHYLPESDDYILEKMYLEEIRDGMRADTISFNTRNAAAEKIISEIEQVSSEAFKFKISFLGDVAVDLRYWVFVLPLFLIFSAIYIFILDYKIVLLKKANGDVISEHQKHPFNFLRNLLLVVQILLVVGYIWVLFRFLGFGTAAFRSSVKWMYFISVYYAFLYCRYIKNRLDKDALKEKYLPGPLDRLGGYIKKLGAALLNSSQKKVRPAFFVGITQALLFSTLFLSMNYTSCGESQSKTEAIASIVDSTTNMPVEFSPADSSKKTTDIMVDTVDKNLKLADTITQSGNIDTLNYETNPIEDTGNAGKEFVKGYELITTSRHWVDQEGQSFIFGDVSGGRFLKYAYIAVMAIALLLFGFYRRKVKEKKTSFISGSLYFMSIFLAIHFFVYFGNYNYANIGVINVIATILIFSHWYLVIARTGLKKEEKTKWVETTGMLIVYLLPFLVSGMSACIAIFQKLNGWIFLYFGLIFLVISSTFIQSRKADNT